MTLYYGFTLDVNMSVRPSVVRISFSDDNLSKYQWILSKFGICIVVIWFWISNGFFVNFWQTDRDMCSLHVCFFFFFFFFFFCFWTIAWVNVNGFSKNLVYTLIFWRSGLGLLKKKFRQCLQSKLPVTRPQFRFLMITLVDIDGFSPNLVYALTGGLVWEFLWAIVVIIWALPATQYWRGIIVSRYYFLSINSFFYLSLLAAYQKTLK